MSYARVERGEGLSPAPSALTRFYDDMEARIARLGGSMRGLRAERQMMVVLASLGMVPDSAIPFIEGLDEADRELAAQQMRTSPGCPHCRRTRAGPRPTGSYTTAGGWRAVTRSTPWPSWTTCPRALWGAPCGDSPTC